MGDAFLRCPRHDVWYSFQSVILALMNGGSLVFLLGDGGAQKVFSQCNQIPGHLNTVTVLRQLL